MQMKVVTRAILLQDDKVLLGKRARGYGAGQWALIGGKPDAGETLEAAIVREVNEEVGVAFEPKRFRDEVDHDPDGQAWRVLCFSGSFRGTPKPNLDEVSDIRLVGPEELDALDIAFNHRQVLKSFFASRPA